MDPQSLITGFLVGAFTGAAATYLADKYTDKRRSKESLKKEELLWKDVNQRFPKLIAEMIEDFQKPEFSGVRKFFVKSQNSMINSTEIHFEYHTDVHSDISAAMLYLQDIGYIEDITPGRCPMYRMYEHFVDRLKSA